MKKSIFLLFALLSLTQVRAYDYIVKEKAFYGLYPKFMYDNQMLIYTKDVGNDANGHRVTTFTIMNDEFNELKSLSFNFDLNAFEYEYQQRESVEINGHWIPVGEWLPVETRKGDEAYKGYWPLNVRDLVSQIEAEATFTQTLFNDDEDIEYIQPIIEYNDYVIELTIGNSPYANYSGAEDYQDMIYQRRVYKDRPKMTGFKIMKEDGSVYHSVYLPNDYWLNMLQYTYVYIINDKYYLEIDALDDRLTRDFNSSFKRITLLYQINRDTGSLSSPKIIEHSANVYPTNLHRSEVVKITLNEPLDHSCSVMVVGVTGQVVKSATIPAGANGTEIDTSAFSAGLYIVNVQDGTEVKENCKIIIR